MSNTTTHAPSWGNEIALSNCDFGCKVHLRKRGCITEIAVLHSRIYGCPRGKTNPVQQMRKADALQAMPYLETLIRRAEARNA